MADESGTQPAGEHHEAGAVAEDAATPVRYYQVWLHDEDGDEYSTAAGAGTTTP